jgi:hypothetical protein
MDFNEHFKGPNNNFYINDQNLSVLENSVLRRTFGTKRNPVI